MEATLKRRRRAGGADRGLEQLATLLLRTWQVELQRYLSMGREPDDVADPDDVVRHLTDTSGARRQRRIDNLTENIELAPARARVDRSTSLWMDVARIVVRNRFDPERFVRRQFAVLSPRMPTEKRSRLPQPEMLKSERAIKNYKAGHGVSITEIQAAFKSQLSRFKVQVAVLGQSRFYNLDSEGTWIAVLTNEEEPLSALFRYCTARRILKQAGLKQRAKFKEIAATYRTAAAIQYVFEADEYDEIWKDHLPEGWSEKAQRIYRSFYGFNDE